MRNLQTVLAGCGLAKGALIEIDMVAHRAPSPRV
jgi:hypothetical protein